LKALTNKENEMTEEILQAAIMQLRAKATARFGLIKDLYHRPAEVDTVDKIVQHSLALAQFEGAMVTLQQYSGALSKQTEAEETSNAPQEPTEVEVEEDFIEDEIEEEQVEDKQSLTEEDLQTRSRTWRKSQGQTT